MGKQAGRQVLEILAGFVLALAAAIWGNTLMLAAVGMFCVLYITLQNGWKSGIISSLLLSLTVMLVKNVPSGSAEGKEAALIIIGLIACAYLFGSVFHRKHGDLHTLEHEFAQEKLLFEEEFVRLEKENKHLHKQLLQGEASMIAAYELAASLEQNHPDRVLNECAKVLREYFQAESFAIYHLDSPQHTLQMQVRIGLGYMPPIVYLEQSSFYERMLNSRTATWKQPGEEDAPMLAIPLVVKDQIEKVMIIPNMDRYRPADLNVTFLQSLLHIIVYHYEKAEKQRERDDLYPGTRIHHMTSFQKYIDLERERLHLFEQPFVCIGMYVRGLEEKHLPFLQDVLAKELCELDQVAYNSVTHMLYVLLPGTDASHAGLVRKRLEAILKEKHIFVINWTVLQNEEAV